MGTDLAFSISYFYTDNTFTIVGCDISKYFELSISRQKRKNYSYRATFKIILKMFSRTMVTHLSEF